MSEDKDKDWGKQLRVITGYVKNQWSSAPHLFDEMVSTLCLREVQDPKINYFYICSNIYTNNKNRGRNLSKENPRLLDRLERDPFYKSSPLSLDKKIDFEEKIDGFDEDIADIINLFSYGYTDSEICKARGLNKKKLHNLKKTVLKLLEVKRELPRDHKNENKNYIVVTPDGEEGCINARRVWEILNEFPNSEVYSNTGKNVRMWENK